MFLLLLVGFSCAMDSKKAVLFPELTSDETSIANFFRKQPGDKPDYKDWKISAPYTESVTSNHDLYIPNDVGSKTSTKGWKEIKPGGSVKGKFGLIRKGNLQTFDAKSKSTDYFMWLHEAWKVNRENIMSHQNIVGFNFAWMISCWEDSQPIKCYTTDEESVWEDTTGESTVSVTAAWTIQTIYTPEAKDNKRYANTNINLVKMEDQTEYPRKVAFCEDGDFCKEALKAGMSITKEAKLEDSYNPKTMSDHMKEKGVFGYTFTFRVVDESHPPCSGGPCTKKGEITKSDATELRVANSNSGDAKTNPTNRVSVASSSLEESNFVILYGCVTLFSLILVARYYYSDRGEKLDIDLANLLESENAVC